jgi:hypothetical protein
LTNNKENRLAKISTAGFFIEIDDYIVVAKLRWFLRLIMVCGQIILI